MHLELLADGLSFPEGLFWSERDGCWYLVEWTGDRVVRLRDTAVETVFTLSPGGGPSGLAQDTDGNFWVCLYSGLQLAHLGPAGQVLRLYDHNAGRPFKGPSDLTLDADGSVYFTDGGNFTDDWETGRPAGAVFRVDPSGALSEVDRAICYANGIGLSPDGRALYVNEHRRNRTLRYTRSSGGPFANREVWTTYDGECLLPPEQAFELGPDGMGVDADGQVWVAHYGGGKVLGLNSLGEVLSTVRLPRGRKPSNVKPHPRDNSLLVAEAELGLVYRVVL
jgi:gluconolactonase